MWASRQMRGFRAGHRPPDHRARGPTLSLLGLLLSKLIKGGNQMIRKLSVSLAALAAMGIAGAASAQQIDPENFGVDVNINVLPQVSLWLNDEEITLESSGANPENSAFVESTLNHINNVGGDISVNATGALPGNDIYFHIFSNADATSANDAVENNAANPAADPAFTGEAVTFVDTTLGASQDLLSVPTSLNAVQVPIVYGISSPNAMPEVDDYSLTVTWTIAP